jgi:uncharacterized protein YecE (DUF72 family)
MASTDAGRVRVGVAGWSVPIALRRPQCGDKSLLEQYAEIFRAVEINSSFYRPHRLATYQRWSASVPDDFRFAVKCPKLITHEKQLIGCEDPILAFMSCVRGLGAKLGALLVQLPPGALFNLTAAHQFFKFLRGQTSIAIACEPRNFSWFEPEVDELFDELQVTRVNADPVPRGCEVRAAGDSGCVYVRLHGSPRMYYSAYSPEYLEELRSTLTSQSKRQQVWCIFDNTASGAAWANAQSLSEKC